MDEGFVVELTFEFFQLERDNATSGQCRFDFVEIFESNGKGTCTKLCGADVESGQKFQSEGNEMRVRFHSDASVTEKGFKASWKELPKSGTVSSLARNISNFFSALRRLSPLSEALTTIW